MLCCSFVYFLLHLSIKFLCFYVDMLTPDGIVPVYSGSKQTFACTAPGKPLGWTITGLRRIDISGPFRSRVAAKNNHRITSNDTGGSGQVSVSVITISRFSAEDNGGTIRCINMADNSVQGTATILIGTSIYYSIGLCYL